MFEDILSNYDFITDIKSISPYGNGRINRTYLIDANEKFVLQKINSDIFKNVEELRKYNINEVETIVSKLTLFQLSNLYNLVKKSLESINQHINFNYETFPGMSQEAYDQMIQEYEFTSKNTTRYEQIMGIILNEFDTRNIEKRFNISI